MFKKQKVKWLLAAGLMATSASQAVQCNVQLKSRANVRDQLETLNFSLAPGQSAKEMQLDGYELVTRLTGACTFSFYSEANLKGKGVTYGTNLSRPARVGPRGLLNAQGAAEPGTWLAKSLLVRAVNDTNCVIRTGVGGVVMDYFASVDHTPVMNRADSSRRQGQPFCAFQFFEGAGSDQSRQNVFLGQNLKGPVRFGPDGFSLFGSQVFEASSLRVFQTTSSQKCLAKVGGYQAYTTSGDASKVGMELPEGQYRSVPRFGAVFEIKDYNCQARFYEKNDFNRGDARAKKQLLGFFSDDFEREIYLPGFQAQSMAVFPKR